MEKIGSEEHLIMAPRPMVSLSTLKTRASDIDDVSSARGGETDEIRLTDQLHHRLLCLPPVDTGKDAYLFLLACFVLSALVWSKFILSFLHFPLHVPLRQLLFLYL